MSSTTEQWRTSVFLIGWDNFTISNIGGDNFASNMRDRKIAVFVGVSFPKSEPFC